MRDCPKLAFLENDPFDQTLQEAHGLVSFAEDGYPLFISNTSEPRFIRAAAEGGYGFQNLHREFDNTR